MTEPTSGGSPSKDSLKKPLILKFEFEGQQYELTSLTSNDTIGDLRAVICSMLCIDDFKKINLKTLQPTRIIGSAEDEKPLSEIFRQARERIVVEEVSPSRSERTDLFRQSTSRIPSTQAVKHLKSDRSEPQIGSNPPNSSSGRTELVDSYNSRTKELDQQQNSLIPTSSDSPIRQRKLPRDQTDFPVCASTGYLLRHPVPSNNSCLFISVHFCLTNGVVDDQIGKSMRKIIADTVASDKERFDNAFLGKPNAEYCQWILDDNNWGGAIELSILCKYFETEIVAIDVKNLILNRFGEDSHYGHRMLLLYDGLHYDPLKFQPLDDSQPIQTLFSTENLEVLTLAEELAKEAKQSHQFTDVNTLSIRCTICNGQFDSKSAQEHASLTGHVDFVEKHETK